MSDVILTSQCEFCRYGNVDDSNKARVKVYCSDKEKELWYGCYVPCDHFSKRSMEE